MKKILAILALSISTCWVTAQNHHQHKQHNSQKTPQQRAERSATTATEKLGLSEEQRAQWIKAALERANANEPIRQKMNSASTDEERLELKRQMAANHKQFEQTIKGFLTAEQLAKYETEKKHRKQTGRQKPVKSMPAYEPPAKD